MGDNMRERIIKILKSRNKALSMEELDHELQNKTIEETQELEKTVEELCNEYIVHKTNKERYMLFEKGPLKKGYLHVNRRGYGFVDLEDEEDIYIPSNNLNGALHNDLVVAEVTGRREKGKLEGRILKVLERKLDTVVGEFYLENGVGYIIPDEDKLKMTIQISKENIHGAVDGHKVLVKILELIEETTYAGEVIKVLGHKNDPGVDILSIVYKYDIEDTFPDEVYEQLKTIPDEVLEEDRKGRTDLTNQVIFTIDGADTKDIDDAISIEKLENGNYKLGVHIADVSYYVREGTPLDEAAMSRGTSVYLVDRVIPMIPHQLSNGICSLNEGVDRLAISCVMEIDEQAKIVDYDIFQSVIRSRKKMTYKDVNSILEQNIVPSGYEPFADDLRMMADLAKILRTAKNKRGYLDFDVDEAKILVDEECHPTEIIVRPRGVGEMLIEDFMIAANECVATHIYFMNLPFIYRTHGKPNTEKIDDFTNLLKILGYTLKTKVIDMNPIAMQNILKELDDKPEFSILSSMLLRSMKKAEYQKENIGHFGLASKAYTHFTSPIRRFPDLTVHRLLKKYLVEKDFSMSTIDYLNNNLVLIAEHSSEREVAAKSAERDVADMKMAEYMENHIGEIYEGKIDTVTNFGFFVELPNLIEGLVHVNTLKGDYFNYVPELLALIGKSTKKTYRIGDTVTVRCIRASKEAALIDFELVEDDKNGNKK